MTAAESRSTLGSSESRSRGLAGRLIDEGSTFYNQGDAAGYCSLYSQDVVLTTPEGRFEGRAAVLPYLESQFAMFPGVQVAVERRNEQDDLYIGEFRVSGRNTGPIPLPDGGEAPATGKTLEVYGEEIAEVRDGKIVRHDMLWDRSSLVEQLGLT